MYLHTKCLTICYLPARRKCENSFQNLLWQPKLQVKISSSENNHYLLIKALTAHLFLLTACSPLLQPSLICFVSRVSHRTLNTVELTHSGFHDRAISKCKVEKLETPGVLFSLVPVGWIHLIMSPHSTLPWAWSNNDQTPCHPGWTSHYRSQKSKSWNHKDGLEPHQDVLHCNTLTHCCRGLENFQQHSFIGFISEDFCMPLPHIQTCLDVKAHED